MSPLAVYTDHHDTAVRVLCLATSLSAVAFMVACWVIDTMRARRKAERAAKLDAATARLIKDARRTKPTLEVVK